MSIWYECDNIFCLSTLRFMYGNGISQFDIDKFFSRNINSKIIKINYHAIIHYFWNNTDIAIRNKCNFVITHFFFVWINLWIIVICTLDNRVANSIFCISTCYLLFSIWIYCLLNLIINDLCSIFTLILSNHKHNIFQRNAII